MLMVTITIKMAGSVKPFYIGSYNLYGLNNGRSLLVDLCNNRDIAVIAVQEHWLTPSNLHLLNNVHTDFVGYGVSAMHNKLSSAIYTGRPFGGVAFLWRRSLSNYISIIDSDGCGRCLALSFKCDNVIVKLVNVYFPCYSNNTQYTVDLGNCIGFIENIVKPQDNAIIIGDVNFTCTDNSPGFLQCKHVFDRLNIAHCDAMVSVANPVTYSSSHLNCSSFIDHCFASHSIRQFLSGIDIVDSAINLSDHMPFIARFMFDFNTWRYQVSTNVHTNPKPCRYVWRWDKTDLAAYYEESRLQLADLVCPIDTNTCECSEHCKLSEHCNMIDVYYNDIVHCIQTAAQQTVVRIKCNSLKPYWNEELDRLKQAAISWHNIWIDAGKPQSGQLFHIKCSTKLKYKMAIRDAYLEFEDKHDDELYTHFINKRPSEFWKSWNAKFRRNINKNVVIEGCQTDRDIANKFALHFSNVYQQVCNKPNEVLQPDNSIGHSNLNMTFNNVCQYITPELVDTCTVKLKKGKATGPDDLSVEHMVYAHPSLCIAICNLFKLIITHRYVPNGFCIGTIVPLVKDKSHNLNDIDNYRPITLIPVISKIFEHVILSLCEDCLLSDQLQFGFKRDSSCSDAIFVLRTSVEYFNSKGSTVFLASLDIRKAFDSVVHDKLFDSLKNAGLPQAIIDVLRNWYGKLVVNVRWGSDYSTTFSVFNGTRQGSVISPTLFNVFINLFIVQLRELGVGCVIKNMFVGCILYADDMILLCPSVKGLQSMLNLCTSVANSLSLVFNTSKSMCIAIGKLAKLLTQPMSLGTGQIDWVDSIKYLGVTITGGTKLGFNNSLVKQNFFAACNCIYAKAKHLDEIIHLMLQESYCLSILTYAVAVIKYSTKQEDELNACWNSVYRKLFGFNKWESVKSFICGLGRLDFHHITRIFRTKFYFHVLRTSNMLLNNMFWIHASLDNSDKCDLLAIILKYKSDVCSDIYKHFHEICSL